MSDSELVLDILAGIQIAIGRIKRRFHGIEDVDDFIISDDGIDRLDGIAMMLIAIGEQVKRLDAITGQDLDISHPEIDWKGVNWTFDNALHISVRVS